jgi:menaquinone-dependent protoporphyrinogen oxidase
VGILILYETVEGQTGKIARFAADVIADLGQTATVLDVSSCSAGALTSAERIILAASVHQRRHPARFEALLAEHKTALAARPTLMLSVSLSAAFPEGLEEAQDYLDEMQMRTGFQADEALLVAGAVRIEKYDYFAMQVVRHVVLKDRNVDLCDKVHEFTDWQAVSEKLRNFVSAPAQRRNA